MKRFAVLALAAVFAFSFTASVAAAPVFSGEFSVETEATIEGESGINFRGSPDLTLKLNASEEGLWELSAELGSVVASDTDVVIWKPVNDDDDTIDIGELDTATITTNGVELGKYYLNVTPGPFGLAAWGNSYELTDVASAFDFIKSGKKATDPKFRLTTDLAGVGLTVDYATNGEDADAVYAFGNAGMIGVAFQDTNVADSEAGMGVAADVTADLGIASVTAGGAFDLNAAEDDGSMAFGVEASADVVPGLTINGGYTSDGRGAPADFPSTEISAGAEYVLDLITVGADFSLAGEDRDGAELSEGDKLNTTTIGGSVAYGEIAEVGVEYMTTNKLGDDDPTLTFTASADYPVIPDVFTVSADFLMVNDKEPLNAGDDYEWVDADETPIGNDAITVMQIGASAAYKLTSAFTVTPGLDYAAYTFEDDAKATATILSVDTSYAVSDSAEITFGFSNVSGKVDGTLPAELDIEDEKYTELSAGVTVSF